MRLAFISITLLFLSCGAALAKSPFDGDWQFTYSCAGADGLYAARCADGDNDYFSISLTTDGSKISGDWEATYQLGNHVDDGELKGSIKGNTATLNLPDEGSAMIKLTGTKLHWHNLSHNGHLGGPPDDAVLTRQSQKQP